MKSHSLVVLMIILLAAVPLYYVYALLKRTILPRQSLGRFFLFMLTALTLAFAYTFLVVFAISKLYLHPMVNK
jgi:multidrug efflux pump subunit AcrB